MGLSCGFQGASWGSSSSKRLNLLATYSSFSGFPTPLCQARVCVVSVLQDRCSPVPAQHTGHNVLPEGEVLLEPPCCQHVLSCTFGILLFELLLACLSFFAVALQRLWSSAAVFSLASKLFLRNLFLFVAYFVYSECTLSSCPVHEDGTVWTFHIITVTKWPFFLNTNLLFIYIFHMGGWI